MAGAASHKKHQIMGQMNIDDVYKRVWNEDPLCVLVEFDTCEDYTSMWIESIYLNQRMHSEFCIRTSQMLSSTVDKKLVRIKIKNWNDMSVWCCIFMLSYNDKTGADKDNTSKKIVIEKIVRQEIMTHYCVFNKICCRVLMML